MQSSQRGGALRATTKAGVAGNRLATIGAEFPFRPCEQARGRKGNSRQPFGFPGPPDTKPRLRRDTKTTASRSARKGRSRTISTQKVRRGRYRAARSFESIPPTSVSCRPKAVSCPREAGLSCPASDGTRRVAGGRGGGGRRSLTAAAPPDANRRSRSIAQPVFVVARSAPHGTSRTSRTLREIINPAPFQHKETKKHQEHKGVRVQYFRHLNLRFCHL